MPLSPEVLTQVEAEIRDAADLCAALQKVPQSRLLLDAVELRAIEGLKDDGMSWAELGKVLGGVTAQAALNRYHRTLGGTRTWPRR